MSLKLNVDTQRLSSLLGWIRQMVCIIEGDRPYTVTDKRSNLKAVYFCSLGWQQCDKSTCTSVPKMGLPICMTHKLVKGRGEGCRRMASSFHCAINFDQNYLDSRAPKVLTAPLQMQLLCKHGAFSSAPNAMHDNDVQYVTS